MTQQVVHARVRLTDSRTLVDQATMSMTFEATGSSPTFGAGFGNVTTAITTFFNTAAAGAVHPVCEYLASDLNHGAGQAFVDYYDVTAHLNGTPAGSPSETDSWQLGGTTSASVLPAQLAILCGFRSAYGADTEAGPSASLPSTDSAIDQGAPATHTGVTRPRARDRGRFYLGPLSGSAIDLTVGAPAGQLVADVRKSLDALCATQLPGDAFQFNLVTWSRRAATVKQIASTGFYYVDGEAFVTQRRRQDTAANRVHTWLAV